MLTTIELNGRELQVDNQVANELDTLRRELTEEREKNEKLEEAANLLQFMEDESFDVTCHNVPTGFDDYEIIWSVSSHHMTKPTLRCEASEDTLVGALRTAFIAKHGKALTTNKEES